MNKLFIIFLQIIVAANAAKGRKSGYDNKECDS